MAKRERALWAVGVILVGLAWWKCGEETRPQASGVVAQPPKPIPEPTREATPGERALAQMTPADDAKREELIADAQRSGLFGEIDYRRHEVVVGPAFYELEFKQKEAVVWAIVLNGMRRTRTPSFDLDLIDSKTGKRTGHYSCLWWKLEMT